MALAARVHRLIAICDAVSSRVLDLSTLGRLSKNAVSAGLSSFLERSSVMQPLRGRSQGKIQVSRVLILLSLV